MARFRREAQVLAALNHPNIAQIYGMEGAALVMEFVPGDMLHGPLQVDETVTIAKQIAEALEAAHEKGIVHRDLKPANIKVTPQGVVKVLDFGLAAVMHTNTFAPGAASGNSDNPPPLTLMGATKGGLILGTAGYMSPEQAGGKPVDRRADIWSFGVVLWEMLTGRRLFHGETVSHTLADVLTRPIDFASLPPKAPIALRVLLRRCLDRNVRTRLRDIGEARIALESTNQAPDLAPAVAATSRRWLWPAAAVGFAILAAVLVSPLLFREWRSPGPAAASPIRATLDLNPAAQLANDEFGRPHLTAMAFSPDGRVLVFSGSASNTTQLFKRALDQSEAVPIPGTTGATGPFFSPDGQWIGFFAGGGLKKIAVNGGPAAPICKTDSTPWGATWGAGNSIVFSSFLGGLKQVSGDGGSPRDLLPQDLNKGAMLSSPEFLPDGKTLLFARRNENWEEAEIDVLTEGGTPRTVVKGANPKYASTKDAGYLLFLKMGTLLAAPFDTRKLQISGSPVALLDGVMQSIGAPAQRSESFIGQFAVSRPGNLAYATGGIYPAQTGSVMLVDRKGAMTDLNIHEHVIGSRLSPDGKRFAAFSPAQSGTRDTQLKLSDLAGPDSALARLVTRWRQDHIRV
jgi:hypothetical protein